MKKDRSEVSFWFDGECLLSMKSLKVPEIGEKIWICNEMDEDWYRRKFPRDAELRFYTKGVNRQFQVKSINRSIRAYDTTVEQKTEKGTYVLPSQSYIETFEVELVIPQWN